MAVGSPVAGRTKSTVLALRADDHAVEGRGEREVADPGLESLLLALGHRQVGPGDADVDLGLAPASACSESSSASAVSIVAFGRLARGDARLQLVRRLEQDLRVDDAPVDLAARAA